MRKIILIIISLISFLSNGTEDLHLSKSLDNFSPKVGDAVLYDVGLNLPSLPNGKFKRLVKIKKELYQNGKKYYQVNTIDNYTGNPNQAGRLNVIAEIKLKERYINDIDLFCKNRNGEIEYINIREVAYKSCKLSSGDQVVKNVWYAEKIAFGKIRESLKDLVTEITFFIEIRTTFPHK